MIINGEYIEKLSDEELCMIEQLTYLDEMVAETTNNIINNIMSKFLGTKKTVEDIRKESVEETKTEE